jgi:hypothetical protein
MTLEEYLVSFIKRSAISHFFSAQNKGMCSTILKKCGWTAKYKFTRTFKSWPEASGSPNFPVFDRTSSLASWEQFMCSKLYRGNQLKLRKSLARHALKELYGRTV